MRERERERERESLFPVTIFSNDWTDISNESVK